MKRIKKWLKRTGAALAALGALIGFVLLYGWRRFREGQALGRAKEEADATERRVEEDRAGVREAREMRDGGTLFRRARRWTERNR